MPTGQQAVLVPKQFSELTASDVSGFREATWTSQPPKGVNPTFTPGTQAAGSAQDLIRAADSHWCSNQYSGRFYYKFVPRGRGVLGSDNPWLICGSRDPLGNEAGNSTISELVYRNGSGQAIYISRTSNIPATSYANAGYTQNTTDTRFNKIAPAATGVFNPQPVTFTSSTSVQTRTTTIAAATGGTGAITYSLQSPPTGVTLNGRVLSFAPAASGTLSVIIRATWTSGTTTAHLDRTVVYTVPRSAAARAGRFVVSTKNVDKSNAAQTVTIEAASGGTGTISYELRTAPAGITLSGRVLTIPASVVSARYNIVVRAIWTTTESTDYRDALFVLSINEDAVAGVFSSGNQALALVTGGAGTFTLSAATGGTGTLTYSLVNPPVGFGISGRNVLVSGVVAAGTASVTARATWTTGSGTAHTDTTFSVTVTRVGTQARPMLCDIPDITIPVGTDASVFVLPEITNGGLNPWTYSVTGLPAGVSFNPSDRTLRVSTNAAAGTFNLSFKAVQGSIEQDQQFKLALAEATLPEVPDEPTEPTGQAIPPGALIKCIPAPAEYPRAQGTNYKLFINGRFVGLGSD